MSNDRIPDKQDGDPQNDADLHSMYVDVMSADGVSTISGPLNGCEFDPVGVYLPPEPQDIHPSFRYDEEEENDGGIGEENDEVLPQYDDTNKRLTPEVDFDPQALGPKDFDPVGAYLPAEEKYNSPPEEDDREEYAARVEEWYNQIEQTFEQHADDTTTRHDAEECEADEQSGELNFSAEQPRVDLPPKKAQSGSDRKSKQRRCRCLTIFIIFVLICAGAGAVGYSMGMLDGSGSSKEERPTNQKDDVNASMASASPTLSPIETTEIVLGELEIQPLRQFNGSDASVVIKSARFVVVGSLFDTFGTDNTFFISNNSEYGDWETVPELNGSSDSAFGSDLAIVDDSRNDTTILLVGSPRDGGNSEGSVSLFLYQPTNNQWLQQGVPIQGANSALEEFGYSVALSNTFLAVVGAPGFSTNSGLVFTFLLSDVNGVISADRSVSNPLSGSGPQSRFGEALDITKEGDFIAIGEPGRNRFTIYTWGESGWQETFAHGLLNGEDYGSSVVFLSSNLVAVGDPSQNNNRGLVQVFQKETAHRWKVLPFIDGINEGDRLGAVHSVSGQEGPLGPEVVVGTKNGTLERYDFVGNRWVKRFSVDSEGPIASVSSFLSANSEFSVLAGFTITASAVLYREVPSSLPPTEFPSTTPTSGVSNPSTVTAPDSPTLSPPSSPPVPPPSPSTLTSPAPQSSPVSSPSFAPILAPVPTISPSSAPPTTRKVWTSVGGPISRSEQNTAFGAAIALVGDFLIVGEPRFATGGAGRVTAFQRSNNWSEAAVQTTDALPTFGSAIDAKVVAGKPRVIIGAIDTRQFLSEIGLSFLFGSAHTFEFDSQDDGWDELGDTILPLLNFVETAGEFGGSVAMASTIPRVAVGAPSSSGDSFTVDSGKVYTFEFNGATWQPMTDPLLGSEHGAFRGTSTDLSKDGSRLLVGEPGFGSGDGKVLYMEWTGSVWTEIFVLEADVGSQEAIGTQVAIVSDDGRTIALGGPKFNGDQGVVRVYEQSGSSFQKVMDVSGLAGEHLGMTLCAAKGRVASGTDTGSFHVFEKTGNDWAKISSGPLEGSSVVSIAISKDANTIAVGRATEHVVVYDFA